MRPIDSNALAALLAALLLAGCATRGGWFDPDEPDHPFADPQLMVPTAAQLLSQGQARSEVQARLGPAEVLRFDSGYEVWVYRTRGKGDARATPELVLLFDPSGQLARLRARPAYGATGG
ncbi:hypothetical protein [Ramlibacter sp.]|uniref:hypothetical protein n=1 Tax=Ramlibacter sp. TaxID=1917967 RepID=UPI002FCA57BE